MTRSIVNALFNMTMVASTIAVPLGPAKADTPAATLKQFGLLGEWSQDCDHVLEEGNRSTARFSYVTNTAGEVFYVRDYGGNDVDHDRINSASISSEGLLEMKVFFAKSVAGEQDRTIAIKMVSSETMRAIYNHNAAGTYTIRDGKYSSGTETPILYKCK